MSCSYCRLSLDGPYLSTNYSSSVAFSSFFYLQHSCNFRSLLNFSLSLPLRPSLSFFIFCSNRTWSLTCLSLSWLSLHLLIYAPSIFLTREILLFVPRVFITSLLSPLASISHICIRYSSFRPGYRSSLS